ncbi:hypothetical protein [Pedobacter sp.]
MTCNLIIGVLCRVFISLAPIGGGSPEGEKRLRAKAIKRDYQYIVATEIELQIK